VVAAVEAWRRQGQGRALREVAVLARLWAQTLGLELAFLERGIPYVKAARSVFDVPEVIGLLGWLRLAAGSLSEELRASTLTETDPVALRKTDPPIAQWMTAGGGGKRRKRPSVVVRFTK